jgi:DNA gyrase inhibitor GyrI
VFPAQQGATGILVMKHAMVYLRPARLAFVRVVGPYETSIPKAWDKIVTWMDAHGIQPVGERGYGLARDNPMLVAAEACRYDACIQVSPEFEDRAERDLGMITLPGGPYVRTRMSGSYDAMPSRLIAAFDKTDFSADLRLDARRPLVSIYLDDPRRFEARDLRADVCVPVATGALRERDAA